MSPVLVDQVVGAVCVLAELAGRRGSKRPGIFLGVYRIGKVIQVTLKCESYFSEAFVVCFFSKILETLTSGLIFIE